MFRTTITLALPGALLIGAAGCTPRPTTEERPPALSTNGDASVAVIRVNGIGCPL